MEYQRAQILRGRSLKDLIVDRTLAGQGFGKSISSSIKDKTKAKLTGLKEKFDPMNISRMVGGRLGAYAYGKLAGRSEEDMAYFAGTRRRSSVTSDALGITPVKNDPLISKVSDGENRPVRKGDGLSTVMARIFNLLKRRILEEKKENEIAKNFEEEQENEKERRHKELLDALKNLGGGTASEEKKGKSFLERVIETVKKMLAKVFEKIKPLLKFVQSLYKLFSKGALGIAEGLLFLAKKIRGRKLALISMAIDAASGGTVGPAANERERLAQTDPYDQSLLDNQTAMFKRGEISSDSLIESASLNAKKRQKLFSRSGIKRILDDDTLSKAQKEEKIGVKDLKEAEDWYEATKDESFAEFQGRVKNDAGKLVVRSGDTRKNLVVQKEDPESAKYVAPAREARILDVPGAGKDIIVGEEPVDNTVEPLPAPAAVSAAPAAVSAAVSAAPAAVSVAPAPAAVSAAAKLGRESAAAAAVVAKTSSTTASEAKALPADATQSAVKVEVPAEKPAPAAVTAVPASKPYIEVADGVRVDSNLPEVQIESIKKSAKYFGGLEDDEMWGNDKEGKLTKLKISGEKKDSNLSEEVRKKQNKDQVERIKKLQKEMGENSSLVSTENTLAQMFQKIQKEFDGLMLASDSTKFKPTIIDASKSVATSGGGNSGTIFSAPVRTDDDTLKLILKKNTHSFA
jgi:hypothetical protein